MIKKCVICGREFEPHPSNRKVCYEDHIHPCPVCGKDVVCNDPKRQSCACSRKCGQQMGNASRAASNLKKYGVSNVSYIPEVQDKISTKLSKQNPKQPKKYKKCEICGKEFELVWPYTQHTCSPKCRGEYRKRSGIAAKSYQKACKTNIDRYGSANPGERPEVHQKMEDTMEERYGVRYARYIPEIEEKVRKTCMERYGVPYFIQTEDANRDNVYRISQLNKDFSAFVLDSAGINLELEKYVAGKFYDFAYNNILIELNPTYTHNYIGNHWCPNGLPANYHLDKTELAQQNNYRCIHVWDWDDWDKIINLIKPKQSIYARNCTLSTVSKQTADSFTAEHHISGRCNGQNLNYGLFYRGKLVSLMTFGTPRYNKNYNWELLRLCSQSDIRVVGGASKLFSAYLEDHRNESVISYCDLSKFTGRVYEKIGMKLIRTTSPAKIWSKGNRRITDNLLRSRGYDQLFSTSYGKGTNNEELMIANKWLPVYDCGQAVYEYIYSV